jgi:hypothetical protein
MLDIKRKCALRSSSKTSAANLLQSAAMRRHSNLCLVLALGSNMHSCRPVDYPPTRDLTTTGMSSLDGSRIWAPANITSLYRHPAAKIDVAFCAALVFIFGRQRSTECNGRARSAAILAGTNFQLSADLLHKRTYEPHSETFALSRIETCRPSRPVVQD